VVGAARAVLMGAVGVVGVVGVMGTKKLYWDRDY
jgi:hypothetical protein